ncbi:C6 transcription factor rosa-like protein [Penicillium argentinense]|uniref:C6 transcription factor rosa-like protein n=1 Tax=Penicillium argentinense TaxID=1131581 RepID=A0A9W9K6T9_9EURO|nr:C6 transcription factor rosa-like protein [Penicillium argentinense]KAJ5094905.1 C6 transcription factor rosa-like protein [Penicillium argentinense]
MGRRNIGNPSRKTHRNSRIGCGNCKKRHIRCDEAFPQCQNCTRLNRLCDYSDTVFLTERHDGRHPDLLMTWRIMTELRRWHMTGIAPLTHLRLVPEGFWDKYTGTDLRLLLHVTRVSMDFESRGISNCSVWVQKMPAYEDQVWFPKIRSPCTH